MARLDLPEGDTPEIVRVWELTPKLSGAVRDLSAGSGLSFEGLGPQRLKGLPEEVEVYRVTTPTRASAV